MLRLFSQILRSAIRGGPKLRRDKRRTRVRCLQSPIVWKGAGRLAAERGEVGGENKRAGSRRKALKTLDPDKAIQANQRDFL